MGRRRTARCYNQGMKRTVRTFTLCTILAATAAMAMLAWVWCQRPASTVKGSLTFNRHVAPIIFEHCMACHRPGEAAPFSLLTYRDVAKRAEQIKEVCQSRFMPPWLPEPGYGEFAGARRLTDEQIATIARWVQEGAPEGDPAERPPAPTFAEGW